MRDEPIKVGGEIEAYCTACKTMKTHVVIALVDGKPAKAECLACHKQHVYRANPPGTPRARVAAPRPAAPSAAVPDDLDERLAGAAAKARDYSPRQRYAIDDVVRHPSFGVGLVIALPAAQKMEVAFRAGRKLLVHERAEEAAPSTLAPPVRVDEAHSSAVTDAPPPAKDRR
jgi:hypothetical protein